MHESNDLLCSPVALNSFITQVIVTQALSSLTRRRVSIRLCSKNGALHSCYYARGHQYNIGQLYTFILRLERIRKASQCQETTMQQMLSIWLQQLLREPRK